MASDVSLMSAVKEKNADEIRRLVADGAQLNCLYELTGDEARSFSVTVVKQLKLLPLVVAANDGDLELCKLLVDLGASLKGSPKPTFLPSPLVNALANRCSVKAVDTLVRLGCDVNEQSAKYRKGIAETPLCLAVKKDNFDAVKMLLEAGADVNLPDDFYCTPIHLAVGNLKNASCTLNKLLDFIQHQVPNGPKPDLNAKIDIGKTPLMTAIIVPTMEAFDRLMKEGVDLDIEDDIEQTALHYAIYAKSSDSEEKVLALLRAGCAISKPHWRHSAFLSAVLSRNERFSEILVEFGASPLEKFHNGWTALHVGARCGRQKLIDLALSAGMSVNALDYSGKTALMKAAEGTDKSTKFNGENIHVIKYLVQQHGARLNIRSFKKKQTALTLCFQRYAPPLKCAMYLLAEGAVLTCSERNQAYKKLCCSQDGRMLVKEECALEFFLLTETAPLSSCLAVYENSRNFNPESRFYQKWKEVVCHPHSLKHCCRLAVRGALVEHANGTGILLVIETLPLPETLKTYLCYNEEMDQAFYLIDKTDKTKEFDDDDKDNDDKDNDDKDDDDDDYDDDDDDDDDDFEDETDARNMMDDDDRDKDDIADVPGNNKEIAGNDANNDAHSGEDSFRYSDNFDCMCTADVILMLMMNS